MAVTLSYLDGKVRERADMTGSEFVTTTEIYGYISDSYKELYDILVGKFEDYYLADPLEFTLSSGESSYDLPVDFYKLIGLDYQVDANNWETVKPFNFAERNSTTSAARLSGSYTAVRYRILGDKLRFMPSDAASGTYRLWYVPRASDKTLAADTIDGVNGWEDYIVVDAAIKCLAKEESDVSVLMAQKSSLLKRIEEMAANRDSGHSQRVSDVYEAHYESPLFYR